MVQKTAAVIDIEATGQAEREKRAWREAAREQLDPETAVIDDDAKLDTAGEPVLVQAWIRVPTHTCGHCEHLMPATHNRCPVCGGQS